MSGLLFRGQLGFRSIPGLRVDFDSRFLYSDGEKIWRDTFSGIVLRLLGGGSVKKEGDYVVVENGSFLATLPDMQAENLYNATPRGIYFLGEMVGAGTTRSIVRLRLTTTGSDIANYRTVNSGGNSRLGYTGMGTSTFTAGTNLTMSAKRCWVWKFGENNTANNVRLYQGNTLLGLTTRNYTADADALGIPKILFLNTSTGNDIKIQRLLIFDWQGFTNSQIDVFHTKIKDIFNQTYGSIF